MGTIADRNRDNLNKDKQLKIGRKRGDMKINKQRDGEKQRQRQRNNEKKMKNVRDK